jgi:hypothetical protein
LIASLIRLLESLFAPKRHFRQEQGRPGKPGACAYLSTEVDVLDQSPVPHPLEYGRPADAHAPHETFDRDIFHLHPIRH